jgi:cytochrome c oxidase assembly protein subunit 11
MAKKQGDIKKTTTTLFFVTILMFGFGYAMVPLYDTFCQITGLNGKTQRVIETKGEEVVVSNREVRILFDANVNGDLPWRLKPTIKAIKVQPGKFYDATYSVTNMSNEAVVGQAIPSVSPQIASLYFKKSECFCFVNQLLEPGETKDMLVRFEVDRDLPEDVGALTLSYTFFRAKGDNS